jgi:GTP-binding protein
MVNSRVLQVQVFDGLGRKTVEQADAGDIVALVGLETVDIGDTLCDPLNPVALEAQEIEPPTLTMMFTVNDAPFVGKEGKYVTTRNLRDRLMKEMESNVALKVEEMGEKAIRRGFGLYLVRTLVDHYGGRVWVEDRVPGNPSIGTRFVVLLPAA